MLCVMTPEDDPQRGTDPQMRRVRIGDLGPPPGAFGEFRDAQDGPARGAGGIGSAVRDGPADEGRIARGGSPVERGGAAALALCCLWRRERTAVGAVPQQELAGRCAVEELRGRGVPGHGSDSHGCGSFRSGRRGEDEGGVVVEAAAVARDKDQLVVADLPFAGLAAGLDDGLR